MYFAYLRTEESVLSSRPCFKTMTLILTQPSRLFYVVGCPTSLIFCNHHAALAHTLSNFGGETNTKNNEIVKNCSSKQKQTILEFFWENQPKKKEEKNCTAWSRGRQVRVSRYLARITSRTPSATNHKKTGDGLCCLRLRQRETDALLTCFHDLVATCDVRGNYPTQQLPLFFNRIQMGRRKNKSCTE